MKRVRDAADVTVACVLDRAQDGRIRSVTGAESLTMHEVAARMTRALGRDIAASGRGGKLGPIAARHLEAIAEQRARGRAGRAIDQHEVAQGTKPTAARRRGGGDVRRWATLGATLAAALALSLPYARVLDALVLGEAGATSLGLPLAPSRKNISTRPLGAQVGPSSR